MPNTQNTKRKTKIIFFFCAYHFDLSYLNTLYGAHLSSDISLSRAASNENAVLRYSFYLSVRCATFEPCVEKVAQRPQRTLASLYVCLSIDIYANICNMRPKRTTIRPICASNVLLFLQLRNVYVMHCICSYVSN